MGSVGHRVKIHKITPVQGKERGDLEIRDYVVLQKPRDGTDCLPPPRTLILDFTMTHQRFGRSLLSSLGQLTHNRRPDGAPEPDGALRTVARAKIRHYRQLYINHPEPIAFMPVAVDTSREKKKEKKINIFLLSLSLGVPVPRPTQCMRGA